MIKCGCGLLVGALILKILTSPSSLMAQGHPPSAAEIRYAYEAWQIAKRKYEIGREMERKGLISNMQLNEYKLDAIHKGTVLQGYLEDFIRNAIQPVLSEVYARRAEEGMELVVGLKIPPWPSDLGFVRDLAEPAIHQLYIQIEANGKIVTRPLEQFLAALPSGSHRTLIYQLLDPSINEINVKLKWLGGEKSYHVPLERNEPLTVRSETDQQEAVLGQSVSFVLTFDKGGSRQTSIDLSVSGLPSSIPYAFRTFGDDARVTRFTFPEGHNEYRLKLVLTLPPQPGPEWDIDVPIPFSVIAKPSGGVEPARLPLSIIPRGDAVLELHATDLFRRVETGAEFEIPLVVRNKGTRKAKAVKVLGEFPQAWQWQENPDKEGELNPRDELRKVLRVAVPEDAGVGDFMVRLWVEGLSGSRPIKSDPVDIRVQVEGTGSFFSVISLILMVLIGAGSAFLVYRWAQR